MSMDWEGSWRVCRHMNGKVDCKEDGRVVTGRSVGQDKKRKEFFIGI